MSYILPTVSALPRALRSQSPTHVFYDVSARVQQRDLCSTPDGLVSLPGGVEFDTKITARQLSAFCDPVELLVDDATYDEFRYVYDPPVQRGSNLSKKGGEVPLVDPKMINDMEARILENREIFPALVMNLRFTDTQWVYIEETRELRIYAGVATRPDSNHRVHSIVGCYHHHRKMGADVYPNYNADKPYGMVIYTYDRDGEAMHFSTLNSLGSKVAQSKAAFVAANSAYGGAESQLAAALYRTLPMFGTFFVETQKKSLGSTKTVLFSAIMRGIKNHFPQAKEVDPDDLRQLEEYFTLLGEADPRDYLERLNTKERADARNASVSTSSIIWDAHFELAKKIVAVPGWQAGMKALTQAVFARSNPVWLDIGLIGKKGVDNSRKYYPELYKYLYRLIETKAANLPVVQQTGELVYA